MPRSPEPCELAISCGRRRQQQTYKQIALPLAHARGVIKKGSHMLPYESRYTQTYSLVFNHRGSPNPPRSIKFNPFRMKFHALALALTHTLQTYSIACYGQEKNILVSQAFPAKKWCGRAAFYFFGAWFITNHAHLRPTPCKNKFEKWLVL